MGLEVVEFVIDVEKALGLAIPDGDTKDLKTPREFVAYLCRRLPEIDPGFGTDAARWTKSEIEQVVEGLLAKSVRRGDLTLDTEFRDLPVIGRWRDSRGTPSNPPLQTDGRVGPFAPAAERQYR